MIFLTFIVPHHDEINVGHDPGLGDYHIEAAMAIAPLYCQPYKQRVA